MRTVHVYLYYFVSEHRKSYDNKKELKDVLDHENLDIIIFAISVTRFESFKAKEKLNKEGIKVGIVNLLWLKPLKIEKKWIKFLKKSKFGGVVIDDDYENGISKSIANDLNLKSKKQIHTMGLKDKTAGFFKSVDNLPPTADEICQKIKKILKK